MTTTVRTQKEATPVPATLVAGTGVAFFYLGAATLEAEYRCLYFQACPLDLKWTLYGILGTATFTIKLCMHT